jgi:hypothetical protein
MVIRYYRTVGAPGLTEIIARRLAAVQTVAAVGIGGSPDTRMCTHARMEKCRGTR